MEKVKFGEKFSLGLGALGQNILYGMITMFLLVFATDILKISGATVGAVFLIARLWDAVNDPIIGLIIDRSNLKSGKFRPFVLFAGIGLSLICVLLFINFPGGQLAKTVYLGGMYMLFSTFWGMFDIPLWSMVPAMTQEPSERTSISAIPKALAMLGSVVVGILTLPLLQKFGNNQQAYFIVAIIYSVVCIITTIICYTQTKERIRTERRKSEKMIDSVNQIIQNKPFLALMLASLLATIPMVVRQTLSVYLFRDAMGKPNVMGLSSIIGMLGMLSSIAIVSALSKKIGKKKTFLLGIIFGIISNATVFITVNNLPIFLLFGFFVGFSGGLITVMIISMQSDTIEYAQWKTNKRSESIIFSFGTLITKTAVALGGSLGATALTVIGYTPDLGATPEFIRGLLLLISVGLPISYAISGIIIFLFYGLTESKFAQIVAEIKERK